MPRMQWARLRADVNCQLRRGGWYRAARVGSLEAVVDVKGEPLTVPSAFLQISSKPPRRWTIVPRPADAVRLPPLTWGPRYAVCPSCRARQAIEGRPAAMRCHHCTGFFELAWNESYAPAL